MAKLCPAWSCAMLWNWILFIPSLVRVIQSRTTTEMKSLKRRSHILFSSVMQKGKEMDLTIRVSLSVFYNIWCLPFSFLGAGILETQAELQPCFSCKNFCQDIPTLLLSHMLSSSISCLTSQLSTASYLSLDYNNISKTFLQGTQQWSPHFGKLLPTFLLAWYTECLFYIYSPFQ